MQMSQLSAEKAAALRLKMADEEHRLRAALTGASSAGEPAAKRAKTCPGTNHGPRLSETNRFSTGSGGKESREPGLKCAQPVEQDSKPVIAVDQAPAPAADNNGLELGFRVADRHQQSAGLGLDYRAADRLQDSDGLEEPEDSSDLMGPEDFPSNGLAVTPEHITEEDDRSSHASSSDWTPQPQIGPYSLLQQHIRETDPRAILRDLLPETILPPDLDDMTLWQIIINISEPPKRKKRKDVNTLEDVVRLLHESKRILVLTGAGVSVSCGIPDFRSRDGIYARLAVDFPDLPDPQSMFDIEYFRRDPRPFFKFAKEIYPGQFQPSPCHKFISTLDKQGKLLRNYTQNIDTLEQVAGVQRIIQCHGSFATASCLICKYKVDCDAIREDIFNQVVPHCPRCPDIPLAIMKPDIVFFGENLPEMFHRAMKQDKDEVDLLIVIGSSLKVRPVALIPNSIPHEVPQVLINREQLPHLNFDVELLGDCDVIINELCHRLGGNFEQLCFSASRLSEITEKPPRLPELLLPPPPNEAPPESADTTQEETSGTDSASKPSEETHGPIANVPTQTDADGTAPPQEPCPGEDTTTPPPPSEQPTDEETLDEAADLRNSSLEFRRRCWMSRLNRSPISKRLNAGQYLFLSPNHYIFHGAEVYSDSEEETSSSCGSDSDESECSGEAADDSDDDGGEGPLEAETDIAMDTERRALAAADNNADAAPSAQTDSEQTQDATEH
ncbi:NAD-dependent protein deacetylase sirtuin-1 [Eucyclogobius newberryi]|uniref:NAD-dependent protein deacetylase sirtuin-1 n=1 Tax=Eucyclogobius newberryi TaxID=166745 RepID=UPI003B5D0137